MTSKIVTMSREAVLAAANRLSNRGQGDVAAPLWKALAAPVVQRQPDAWRYAINGMWEWCADREQAVRELAAFHAGDSAEELAELEADGLHVPQALYVDPSNRSAPIVEADGMGAAPITLNRVMKAYDYANDHPHKYLRGTTNWCAAVAHSLNASQPAPVSVVLLLEWSEISDPTEECRYTHVTAKTAIGTYSIEWKAHKQFDDRTLFLDGDHVSSGHDLAEAKAKAQEHHCARVIACLYKPKEPTQ